MRKWINKLLKLVLVLLLIPWVYAIVLNYIYPPATLTQINSLIEGYGMKRDYLSGNKIPECALWSVVAAEDQKFGTHHGFDSESIKKALKSNAEGKKLRGASTLSQQTAKNVFLWQGRSWLRKGLETYCTFVLETVLSKRRILEIYLNIAEMGQGTFGIEAAAQYYYKKPAQQLTANECARIVAALPSPKKYNVNPPSAYVSKRARWIERQLRNLKTDTVLKNIINP